MQMPMNTLTLLTLTPRINGENDWLSLPPDQFPTLHPGPLQPEVLPTEDAVAEAQLAELRALAKSKDGPLVILLLGGRGAQALHRKLGELAKVEPVEEWIPRLHIFMQDALAPMPSDSSLSFVADFKRLFGPAFLTKVGSFNLLRTDAPDLEQELANYVQKLFALGGPDIFFLGHGPEEDAASHLCYIRPGSGAQLGDMAGLIPISSSILEHHISKFKAGGTNVCKQDEDECRRARFILTMGPAVILKAKRLVQSIVDADTAPAKKLSYRRVLETVLSSDPLKLAEQLDQNPGLWVRLHPSVRSLILPNVLIG
jgi:6-phosphogluconolactonase/glucosamine-6-phosphate isomerase/deaminase